MTRWNRRLLPRSLVVGAVALLVPALAGCEAGLNAPTLQYHPASPGATTTVNGVSVDNLFVLGPALGATVKAGGRASAFLAVYSTSADKLESISAPGTATSVKIAGGPVSLPADTLVDMSGPKPTVVLSGLLKPLSGGETITMVLTFASIGSVTMRVPVEPRAYDYATYSPPVLPSPTATPRHVHPTGRPSPPATPPPPISG